MLEQRKTFESRVAAEAGMIVDRKPQPADPQSLPRGLTLVSADNHMELTEDVFYREFPAHLRHAAPRVWFDKYWRIGFKEQMEAYPTGVDIDTALSRSVLNEGFDLKIRKRHLEAEGIAKEIAYPQSLLAFVRHPDQQIQQLMYGIYNEYLADLARRSPGRFHGVGICSNWWDPAKAESAIRQIVDLQLKSFMLPFSPGKGLDGKPIDYAGAELDRLWAAAAEAGLPVSFHIGEVPAQGGRGGFGTFFIVQAAPFRRVLGNLIFGGILDRHPSLRIVFAEGGINWVAGALQDAELTYGAHREIYDWQPKHRPSHYWHTNCYATFQTDPIGLELLEHIGADRVMWAQDYPHSEGTFGYTADALREITERVSEADARKILGGTAIALYRLN
ncbi:MAG TPA: amidohydrolase family protein [Steroidobacteraceae bacterium]|nr:amidohydrolase family protein [Steroidobacteraceae bacterium]